MTFVYFACDCLFGNDISEILLDFCIAYNSQYSKPRSTCCFEGDIFIGVGGYICDSFSSCALIDIDEISSGVATLLQGHEASISEGESSLVVVLVGSDVEISGGV